MTRLWTWVKRIRGAIYALDRRHVRGRRPGHRRSEGDGRRRPGNDPYPTEFDPAPKADLPR